MFTPCQQVRCDTEEVTFCGLVGADVALCRRLNGDWLQCPIEKLSSEPAASSETEELSLPVVKVIKMPQGPVMPKKLSPKWLRDTSVEDLEAVLRSDQPSESQKRTIRSALLQRK